MLLGSDERYRPFAGLLLEHLATGAHASCRVRGQGFAAFLLVLNGGAIVGALIGSRVADRLGPKLVVAACFLIGGGRHRIAYLSLPLAMLLLIVAFAGLGTSGTQTLIYGFVANYYRTNVRGAAVAWCAGFGRLGGVAARCSAAS